MANVLGNYNPTFFANEALQVLYKSLGFAGRVYRGLDEDRNTSGRQMGEVINIRRPSHFTAEDHVDGTGSSDQDLTGQNVQIQLTSHKEVKFKITDRELAYTSERIIDEHIAPAAFAVADQIDKDLHGLGGKIGPKAVISGTPGAGFITGPRRVLRNNAAPMDMIHYLVDTGMEAAFLNLGIFHEAQITGPGANEAALMRGSLGTRFGVEVFGTQNADQSVPLLNSTATASAGTGDEALAVDLTGGYDANVSTMHLDGGTGTQTFKVGDTFTLDGDPQSVVYILTANTTLVGGSGDFSFYPPLRKNVDNNDVVQFQNLNAVQEAAHLRNLMFHTNAIGLAFAPLPMTGDGRGAEIDTVSDPVTGLSIRARMWYNGARATNYVALDVLYGYEVLDGQMGVRVLRAPTVAPV